MVEILVVISIISILAAVIYASFGDARAASRDKVRKTSLKELALALELYKSQHGTYPEAGCGSAGWTGPGPGDQYSACDEYIVGLVPEFMSELPKDPQQDKEDDSGFLYYVSPAGDSYKVLVWKTVETSMVTGYDDPFARCPRNFGTTWCGVSPQENTYSIYSRGEEGR